MEERMKNFNQTTEWSYKNISGGWHELFRNTKEKYDVTEEDL